MSEETGLVNVYIEIEQFSNQKCEFNKKTGVLELDRVLPHPFVYPYAYGFIPNTLADDGDDLDALIITNESLEKGKECKAQIVGVLLMEDEKGKDEKIICVLENDASKIKDIYDLDLSIRNNIKWFFENYKKEEPGKWSKVSGYDSKEKAINLYNRFTIKNNKNEFKNNKNEFKNNKNDCKNVFVYCSGKCGSATLLNTFTNNKFDTIHLHDNSYYKHAYKCKNSIFELIDKSCKQFDKIYIIDSYRTPIERKISSFFQNIKTHIKNYESMSIDELVTFFNKNLLNKIEEYHSINEVLSYYKIPLFSNFNFESRYNIAVQNNKVFIKILFKDINKWGKILSDIFGKEIVIHSENLTNHKKINNLYSEFKKKYRVPKSYIDIKLNSDKEFKIYNTKEDRDKYIKYWTELSI